MQITLSGYLATHSEAHARKPSYFVLLGFHAARACPKIAKLCKGARPMLKALNLIAEAFTGAIVGIVIAAGTPPAHADPVGTPPPTSPTLAIDIGSLGNVPNGQTLFRSTYDSGKLFVGTQFFPQLWYKFSTGSGEAATMQFQHWTAQTGAAYKVYDHNLHLVGDLTDPGLKISKNIDYYVEVSADHPTSAHFALEIRPALDAFQNDAGDSEQSATNLGALNNVISHAHQFYTYFTRTAPDLNGSSTTPGSLAPIFSHLILRSRRHSTASIFRSLRRYRFLRLTRTPTPI
jgi:hypothetical protein